jgi:hypothetical protein
MPARPGAVVATATLMVEIVNNWVPADQLDILHMATSAAAAAEQRLRKPWPTAVIGAIARSGHDMNIYIAVDWQTSPFIILLPSTLSWIRPMYFDLNIVRDWFSNLK